MDTMNQSKPILRMQDLDLAGKRVLIRQDLNVPMNGGEITNDARIRASLPTIQLALSKGAKVMVMSHLGRPTEGEYSAEFSLIGVARHLGELLSLDVPLVTDWVNGLDTELTQHDLLLCENVRFNVGEKSDDERLARKMAELCDVFVMDAFGTAHRAQASTHGVAQYAPVACAGPLLCKELDALASALENPAKPVVAIVGGSKVSTKLTVLSTLSKQVDQLIVGGGIANTFIAAAGHSVGKSLYEPDLVDQAKSLSASANAGGGDIPVPTDVVCGLAFSPDTPVNERAVSAVADDEMVFDIGHQTAARFAELLKNAGTILWNGPVGVFEFDAFAKGTQVIAEAIADSPAFSVAGGGDTVAAIDKFGVADRISYISTGGGAFLEFLEGKKLPAVEVLEKRA